MKDGYYWARLKAVGDIEFEWQIVDIEDGFVRQIGWELENVSEDYEFGDRIETPEKYE